MRQSEDMLPAVVCLISPILMALSQLSTPSTSNLDWLTGQWRGTRGQAVIEERWQSPTAGVFLGTFSSITNGQPRFYEFMTITPTGSGRSLFIRHFEPDLTAWEEKDAPLRFRLIADEGQRAIFEAVKDGSPERLIYERESDTLKVTLEKQNDGQTSKSVFMYDLVLP